MSRVPDAGKSIAERAKLIGKLQRRLAELRGTSGSAREREHADAIEPTLEAMLADLTAGKDLKR